MPELALDARGECQYCKIHDALEEKYPKGVVGKKHLEKIAETIKKEGRSKDYDCIVGVSGGRDSTYTLLTAVNLGLRPLAVHFDNGWNSAIAVRNIKNAVTTLGVDLHTVVANWKEFRDLQRSFFRASVPDADIPTDYAIYSVLFSTAAAEGTRFILEGHSFRTEGTTPKGWTYMDGRYVRSVHEMFGELPITSFPILSMSRLVYYTLLKRIRYVRALEYLEYNQARVSAELEEQVGWEYYGGHHHESTFTHFFQTYYLPKKFGIDKRKTELSALVRSGQLSRERAITMLSEEVYEASPALVEYAFAKLGFSEADVIEIMSSPPKSFRDYPSYYPMIRSMAAPIRIACRVGLLPEILYLKYAK